MAFQFTNVVESLISVYFPGGVEGFIKEGSLTIVPEPAKEIVVYHPDMGEELVRRLTSLNNDGKDSTVHIMKVRNFPALDDHELMRNNLELSKKIEKLDPGAGVVFSSSSNLVVISLPDAKAGDDSLPEQVSNCLRNTEGLVLAYVITEKTVRKIIQDKCKQIPETIQAAEHGVITRDDVLNLIIDLERCRSVDDFLKLSRGES